ncbi:phosphatidate cytidylyltransferase [Bdellovibrio svalbardensis]|uniref:Phosphatidate cytidylyltransferase n=1 Tax=Bdellovibrio svalbardensis TaxID=2972972 RepID=A0ABT6DJU5_9BACT|nr:phosphatidate cytidylyltransferase [Bdellovibrio svalbardensis]MDG0817122.1 phosphatidate cytidylyltransferase [Bdellovibrio svalbardensis]
MFQIVFFVIANGLALYQFGSTGQTSLLMFFLICIGLLSFFSVLITKLEKKGHKSAHELMARTLTFWWMLSLFGIALVLHPAVLALLLCAGSLLSLAEYHSLVFPNEKSLKKIIEDRYFLFPALGCMINYLLLYSGLEHEFLGVSATFLGVLIPIFYVMQNQTDGPARSLSAVTLGYSFFAVLLPLAFALYRMEAHAFLLVVFLTEIRDLVSYWIGKAFSKTPVNSSMWSQLVHKKVAANVSPQKTWWVGIVSTIVLLLIGLPLSFSVLHLDNIGLTKLMLVIVAIGILGLFGDLAFSLIKRIHGQKDSGTWLPGGSGIIDRIDALVFTIPVAYFLIKFL